MLDQIRLLLGLLAISLCFSVLEVSAQSRFTYSYNEADTILIDFNKAIKKHHPYAYQGNGAETLDSVLSFTRERLPSLLVDDSIHVSNLIELASTFNTFIGDGHLQLTRKREKNYKKLIDLFRYDFDTRYLENGKIVLNDTLILLDSTIFYPGTQVLSFQGEPAAQIYARLGAFIGINDHDLASAKTYPPSRNPGKYYQLLYGWQDSLTAELVTGRQKHEILLLPAARMKLLNRDTTESQNPKLVPKLTRKEKKQKQVARMKAFIKLDTTHQPDIYVLQVRSFSTGNYEGVNQYKYTKNLMKRLDSLQAKGLVIDVRNNTGGSLNFVNHIYGMVADRDFYSGDQGVGYSEKVRGKSYFARMNRIIFGGVRKKDGAYTRKTLVEKQKPSKGKEHFAGEVIALVNQATFSGGTCLANYVQVYERGKVVGQQPGGSSERMFAGKTFKEPIGPDGALLINMPLWYMDMPGDNIGNLTPDIIVPITVADVKAQRDQTLEVALKSFSFFKDN